MDQFVKYIDQVKAEEELKEKTRAFLSEIGTDSKEWPINAEALKSSGRGNFAMKKIIGLAVSVAACVMIAVGGYVFYNKPVSYVSFDINPSVELGINAFDRVVSVKGVNEDGQDIVISTKLKNLSVENAIQMLVQETAVQGYIASDGTSVIALTALSDNEKKAVLLQDQSRDRLQQYLREKEMDCIVYADHADLQLRTKAEEQGLSPGKFRLIEIMLTLDPSITVEQYQYAKVTEIIKKVNELLASHEGLDAVQLGEFERNRDMIMVAAQKIMTREQNQNQIQNPLNGEQQQNQIQEQSQTQNQTQTQTQAQDQEQTQAQEQIQDRTQTQDQSQTQTKTQDGETQNMPDAGSQNTSSNKYGS